MEPELQNCTNCLKPFPNDRIDLHEAYCCRNIRKCKQCQKMIDLKDQELHDAQFHDQKQCHLCQAMIDPSLLQQHLQSCPNKIMNCQFCENNWCLAEYQKHQEVCGARTKPCLICQKNVSFRDFDEHSQKCQRRREERAQVSQDQYRDRGQRRVERNQGERERQNSTNNLRQPIKSTSTNKILKPASMKPSNMIGPEIIKPCIDPVPISIRLALKNKEQNRIPLKSKN